ncbi:MAG: hypothetical protein Q4G42_03415 [Neisseria sp.]|nr:hypothetical protein [Neisseria sp.]
MKTKAAFQELCFKIKKPEKYVLGINLLQSLFFNASGSLKGVKMILLVTYAMIAAGFFVLVLLIGTGIYLGDRYGNPKHGWWVGGLIPVIIAAVYPGYPLYKEYRLNKDAKAAFDYYCKHEAGTKIYKTLDQWKAENPSVWETLKEVSWDNVNYQDLPNEYKNNPNIKKNIVINGQVYHLTSGGNQRILNYTIDNFFYEKKLQDWVMIIYDNSYNSILAESHTYMYEGLIGLPRISCNHSNNYPNNFREIIYSFSNPHYDNRSKQ